MLRQRDRRSGLTTEHFFDEYADLWEGEDPERELIEAWHIPGDGWHLSFHVDWKEIARVRLSQRAYLARYGRQDMNAWRYRPIPELVAAVIAIRDIVRQENALSRAGEDR